MPRRVRSRRHVILDLPMREAIVIARYGSLQPGQQPRIAVKAIAEYFHVPYSTVLKTLTLFKQNGRVIKRPRGALKKQIPLLIRQLLLNRNTLERWARFNLRQRVERCRVELKYEISLYRLRNFYLENNVRYLMTAW